MPQLRPLFGALALAALLAARALPEAAEALVLPVTEAPCTESTRPEGAWLRGFCPAAAASQGAAQAGSRP